MSNVTLNQGMIGKLLCAALADWWRERGPDGQKSIGVAHTLKPIGTYSCDDIDFGDLEDGTVIIEVSTLMRRPNVRCVGMFVAAESGGGKIVIKTVLGRQTTFFNAGFVRAPMMISRVVQELYAENNRRWREKAD